MEARKSFYILFRLFNVAYKQNTNVKWTNDCVFLSPRKTTSASLRTSEEPAHWPSGRVFAKKSEDWSSISGRIILKTQKMVLDTSLLCPYKVPFKGKME